MDSFETGHDTDPSAHWSTEWADWPTDNPGMPPAAHHELEIVPSVWDDSAAAGRPNRRRLIIIVATAAILAGALLWWLLRPHHDTPSVKITPSAPTTTTALAEAPTETEVAVPTSNTPAPTGHPETGPAADVAAGFAADYANTAGGKDAWFDRISRWTTPQLADGYRLTDPNRLPDAAFQHLSPPLDSDSGTVIYNATYTTMTLEIRVVFVDSRWLVTAALDTGPRHPDSSPPGSTPAPTTPYLPPDIGAPPNH